jgi:hypothetical protein
MVGDRITSWSAKNLGYDAPGAMGHADRTHVVARGPAARSHSPRPGEPLDIVRAERAAKRHGASVERGADVRTDDDPDGRPECRVDLGTCLFDAMTEPLAQRSSGTRRRTALGINRRASPRNSRKRDP